MHESFRTSDMAVGANGSSKPKVTGQVKAYDAKRVKPNPANPRKRFRRIAELAENIKTIGQTSPGRVTTIEGDTDFDVMLVDGERRLRACLLADMPFEARVVTDKLAASQRLAQAVGAN